jgi:hypothetical protein
MNFDELTCKIEALCDRLEDCLAELQSAQKPAGPYAKLRETFPNAGKAWSKTDDEELARLHSAGNTVADLAVLFGRTQNGVRVRLERLGLLLAAAAA